MCVVCCVCIYMSVHMDMCVCTYVYVVLSLVRITTKKEYHMKYVLYTFSGFKAFYSN